MEIQELFLYGSLRRDLLRVLEQEMITHLAQVPTATYSFRSRIGEVTAAGLIGEVGDFRKFRTMSEIMKLAGLDPSEVSSGRHKGQRHISNAAVRRCGSSVLCRPQYRHKAVPCTSGIGAPRPGYAPSPRPGWAVGRKILGIFFALVRDRSEYVPNYSKVQCHLLRLRK